MAHGVVSPFSFACSTPTVSRGPAPVGLAHGRCESQQLLLTAEEVLVLRTDRGESRRVPTLAMLLVHPRPLPIPRHNGRPPFRRRFDPVLPCLPQASWMGGPGSSHACIERAEDSRREVISQPSQRGRGAAMGIVAVASSYPLEAVPREMRRDAAPTTRGPGLEQSQLAVDTAKRELRLHRKRLGPGPSCATAASSEACSALPNTVSRR